MGYLKANDCVKPALTNETLEIGEIPVHITSRVCCCYETFSAVFPDASHCHEEPAYKNGPMVKGEHETKAEAETCARARVAEGIAWKETVEENGEVFEAEYV